MSAAEVMTETATGLWQRLKTESIWAEKEAERCCVSETDANWKKPTKMPRVNASLPKQAAKKEEIQRSEHYYNNVTIVAMELTMSWAVICGCFNWSEILLFTLAFIWPSFCIPSVIVGISISVCTEVSVLSFGFELVDIVNHYWIEKKIKIAVVINLVCGRVHCYWDAVIIPEEQRYFSFFLFSFFSFWTKWWTYYKSEKGSSFCWPFHLGNRLNE